MIKIETLQPDRLEQQAGPGNSPLIKPILPKAVLDLPNENRTEELVDRLITIIWAKEALNQYNDLPKANSQERKRVNNLVTQTAGRLLENPQNINIAEKVWTTNGAEQDEPIETQGPFSELVRKECVSLIKEKWEDVKPEQLAQLVRIYTNNGQYQDFAKEMLSNYFKGPPNRCSQRVLAYYNFVSATLDLAGEDEAFREGMKIALYATDILPRDPSFVEQLTLLSLPSKEEEKGGVFQKLLIIESVTKQAISMSSQDFTEYFQGNGNFVNTNTKIIQEWYERKKRVTAERGSNEARIMSNKIVTAMNVFSNASKEPLSEERKRALKDIWPFNLAFDKNDPLNQKFQKVLSQITDLKIKTSLKESKSSGG